MRTRLIAALALTMLSAPHAGAAWPEQPVKLVVPFAAGGYPDLIARVAAQGMGRATGGVFVVENRPGASGNIGMVQVARSKADGYTFGIAISASLTTNSLLYSKLPYQPSDFALLLKVTTTASVLAVRPELGASTVQELIALLKREPGKHNYANVGLGTFSHMFGEQIGQRAEAPVTSVLYSGAPDTVSALLRGDVTFALLPASTTVPLARAGKVRALAVTSARRLEAAPEIPTLAESGVDFVGDAWIGFVAPAGTPPEVMTAFRRAAAAAFNDPAARAALAPQFVDVRLVVEPEFTAEVRDEAARFKPLIERLRLKLD